MVGRVEQLMSSSIASLEEEERQHKEHILLCTLNRRPKELQAALSKTFKPYIEALAENGHNWTLEEGSLVFVYPYQYESTMLALQGRKLWPSNLIVAESLEYLVEEAIAGLGGGAWAQAVAIQLDCCRKLRVPC